MTKEQILRISGVNRAASACAAASAPATCPAYDEMEYHPHQFVYMVEKGEIEQADELALHLQVPVLLCVRGALSPRRGAGQAGRGACAWQVIRQQGANHMTPDDIPALAG